MMSEKKNFRIYVQAHFTLVQKSRIQLPVFMRMFAQYVPQVVSFLSVLYTMLLLCQKMKGVLT